MSLIGLIPMGSDAVLWLASARQQGRIAEESEVAADRRHGETVAQRAEHAAALRERLESLIQLGGLQTEIETQTHELIRQFCLRQEARWTVQDKQAWAMFRQTPDGVYYRDWERSAATLVSFVASRDELLQNAMEQCIQSAQGIAVDPAPDPPGDEPEPPELVPVPDQPLQPRKELYRDLPWWLVPLGILFWGPFFSRVGLIITSVIVASFMISGLVGSIAGRAFSTHLPWLGWGEYLPWWGWLLTTSLGVAIWFGCALLLISLEQRVGRFDGSAFNRALRAYEEKLHNREQAQKENQLLEDQYAMIAAEYRRKVDSYEKYLARYSDVTHRARVAAEELQRNLSGVDWMAHPELDRQRLVVIAEILDRGRTIHPDPEDLPSLRVPETRSPRGLHGSAVQALIAAWSRDPDID